MNSVHEQLSKHPGPRPHAQRRVTACIGRCRSPCRSAHWAMSLAPCHDTKIVSRHTLVARSRARTAARPYAQARLCSARCWPCQVPCRSALLRALARLLGRIAPWSAPMPLPIAIQSTVLQPKLENGQ